jgi:hypothetical protein
LLTGEGGGGVKSYDGENACSSINYSRISAVWPCLTIEAGLIRIYEVRVMDGFMLHPFLIGIREIVRQSGPINREKKAFLIF